MKRFFCLLLLAALLSSGCGVVKVVRPDVGPEEPRIERTEPYNLGFEEGDPGNRVPGWRETASGQYQIELVDDVRRSGKRSAAIRARRGETSWGALNQDYAGGVFAGKTVRVRAWIKVEDTEICEECNRPDLDESLLPEGPRRGAQVRVLGYSPNSIVAIGTETLVTPLVMGTKDWTLFEAFTAFPADIQNVIIAPILWGKGKAWFDDIEVLVE